MTNLYRRALRRAKSRNSDTCIVPGAAVQAAVLTNTSESENKWKEVRDWCNVGAALGSLLVGAVAFWTTARISGLEDYLKSEIQRRNSELNSLSQKSSSLEKISDEREGRLSELQASTEALVAASLEAQRQIIENQAELNRTRFKINSAEQALGRTMHSQDMAKIRFSEQSDRFDLFKKKAGISGNSSEYVLSVAI